ncbi:hypothetical protein AMTR_s00013p00253120 [Amborella trichopoda]|uniref:Uncharacterized protein n=1 Tax=Amborella trichopoda TaxID=13333 RepID=W1PJ86_AMBTC|nr:hypothetical protein AMTR_s00013p00253120 [Amborella trichopoda]
MGLEQADIRGSDIGVLPPPLALLLALFRPLAPEDTLFSLYPVSCLLWFLFWNWGPELGVALSNTNVWTNHVDTWTLGFLLVRFEFNKASPNTEVVSADIGSCQC